VDGLPIATVGRALRRRHWLVWGTALGACVVALVAALVRPPTYQATAVLALDETQTVDQGFDVAMQADQYLTQRYIASATGPGVLGQVCRVEGRGCDAASLARRVSAAALKTTGLIGITANASSPGAASRLANDVARQLLTRNQSEVDAYLAPQRTLLQEQLSQTDGQIADVQRSIQAAQAAGGSEAAVSNAQAPLLLRLQQLQADHTATYSRLQDVRVLQSRLTGSLVIDQPATPPARPIDPDPLRYLLVGGAGGLAAGFLAALAFERYRDRIEDSAELAEATGSPVVLVVDGREPPAVAGPRGLLGHAGLLGPAQVVLVAAAPGEPVNEVAMAMDGAGLTIHCLPAPVWLGRAVGPAILVATRGRTRRSEARRTSQVLRRGGVEPVAAILLAPDAIERWREREPSPQEGEGRVRGPS
jgi:capsular polysaccharide biosynthesis protein